MKKQLISATMAVAMTAAVLTGCSYGDSSSTTTTAAAKTESTAAEADASGETKAAAESTGSGDLSGKTIYGIYKAGDQTWFINEGEAAKAAVEAAGGSFTYVDAKMSPEECLKAVDNAIANQAAGIAICVPDQTMSQSIVDKCTEAGIPVVAADDALEVNGEKIAPWVGIDGYVIGEANYAIDNNLVSDPEAGLLIMTMDTVSSCVPRTEGELDKWNELVPEFDQSKIFKADNDGTTDKGNTAATAVITAHPEIKKWLVMGANEECCIGAVRALESAGLDKDSCVIGLGGYMAKDEWNNKGADGTCMKASCYFSETQVGAGSIEVLMDAISGKEPKMETAVPATVVTPDNYKEVMGAYAE